MSFNKKARAELVFEWEAEFLNGVTMKQFDEEINAEYNFGHIDQDKLKTISLKSKRDGTTYTLDFQSGLFFLNDDRIEGTGLDYSGKEKSVKLILFRRVKRLFTAGEKSKCMMTYFLGWQGKVEGEAHKHGLQIFEDSSYAIPPDDSFHAL